MTCAFSRLVRFRASNDQVYYGEPGDTWQQNLKGLEVETFVGSSPFSLKPSGKKAVISEVRLEGVLPQTPVNISLILPEVLCPLASVPAIIGIGLNYKKHAEEADVSLSARSDPVRSRHKLKNPVAPLQRSYRLLQKCRSVFPSY